MIPLSLSLHQSCCLTARIIMAAKVKGPAVQQGKDDRLSFTTTYVLCTEFQVRVQRDKRVLHIGTSRFRVTNLLVHNLQRLLSPPGLQRASPVKPHNLFRHSFLTLLQTPGPYTYPAGSPGTLRRPARIHVLLHSSRDSPSRYRAVRRMSWSTRQCSWARSPGHKNADCVDTGQKSLPKR